MTVRHTIGCMLIVGLFTAGCAMRESRALSDLHQARDAIAAAKQAGSLPPEKIAELEQRHRKARVCTIPASQTKLHGWRRRLLPTPNHGRNPWWRRRRHRRIVPHGPGSPPQPRVKSILH